MTKSHSKPFFFRSAAISRCFCSMASLILVASLYSFFSKLLVTCSHNFRDSFGCCRDSGRTDLGTTCKIDRSIRVFHSYRFAWFVRGGHKGTSDTHGLTHSSPPYSVLPRSLYLNNNKFFRDVLHARPRFVCSLIRLKRMHDGLEGKQWLA